MAREISMRVDPLFFKKFEKGREDMARRLKVRKISQTKFSKLLGKSESIDLCNIKLLENEKTTRKKS